MGRFMLSGGLLEPKHVEAIGPACWVWLLLISWERDKSRPGLVNGGEPVTTTMIEQALGLGKATVQRHLKSLRKRGYIVTEPVQGGQVIRIAKPKRWSEFAPATPLKSDHPSVVKNDHPGPSKMTTHPINIDHPTPSKMTRRPLNIDHPLSSDTARAVNSITQKNSQKGEPDDSEWGHWLQTVQLCYPTHRKDARGIQALLEQPFDRREVRKSFLDGLSVYLRSEEWKKAGGQFVPKLSNFIADTRWENPPTPQSRQDDPENGALPQFQLGEFA